MNAHSMHDIAPVADVDALVFVLAVYVLELVQLCEDSAIGFELSDHTLRTILRHVLQQEQRLVHVAPAAVLRLAVQPAREYA